jgi:hypothetical protein
MAIFDATLAKAVAAGIFKGPLTAIIGSSPVHRVDEVSKLVLGVDVRAGKAGDGAAPLLARVQAVDGVEVELLLGDMALLPRKARCMRHKRRTTLSVVRPPQGAAFSRGPDTWRHHYAADRVTRRRPPGPGAREPSSSDYRRARTSARVRPSIP